MGSWMLAAACDLAMAAEDAKFADRSVRWGGVILSTEAKNGQT